MIEIETIQSQAFLSIFGKLALLLVELNLKL